MRMPVVFSGHGSPMVALDHNDITKTMTAVGEKINADYQKPKAILSISAHWYTKGTFVQSAAQPRQIYDMYGFPKELYQVKYPARGDAELTERVQDLLGNKVEINDSWGIDHGSWTVLVHMYPNADVPVVQLSVNGQLSAKQSYDLGKKLIPLRDEGYLVFASGNIVHNLSRVEWDNPDGTPQTHAFNDYIIDAVKAKDADKIINYEAGPNASYAVPTPDHYLPIAYALGAADGDSASVFNNVCNLGSMAMTGFIWG